MGKKEDDFDSGLEALRERDEEANEQAEREREREEEREKEEELDSAKKAQTITKRKAAFQPPF